MHTTDTDTGRSLIVNHLRHGLSGDSKGRIGIMFMYLRCNETEQTLDHTLSSLLEQLLQESENIPPNLFGLYERHQDRITSPTTDEISQPLSTITKSHETVCCIIDALDECPESLRWELVESLQSSGPTLRVMVTSRYVDSIAEELDNYQPFEIRVNKADIELFIEKQSRRNNKLQKTVERSPSLRNDIKQRVVNTAENS